MSESTPESRKGSRYLLWGFLVLLIIFLGSSTVRIAVTDAIIATGIFDSAPPEEIEGAFVNAELLSLQMETTDGEKIRLSDFDGNVVMLTYWASWCSTCRKTNPTIQTLKDELGRDDITFLLLSMDNVPANAVDYLNDRNYTLTNVFPGRSLPSPLSSTAIPTTIVIDKEGRVVYRNSGYANYSRTGFREWISEVADRG